MLMRLQLQEPQRCSGSGSEPGSADPTRIQQHTKTQMLLCVSVCYCVLVCVSSLRDTKQIPRCG